MHRACAACGYDLCIQCCKERRDSAAGKKLLPCPICLEPLQLLRINPEPFLALLRKLLQLYDTPSGAGSCRRMWSWVDAPGGSDTGCRALEEDGNEDAEPSTSAGGFDGEAVATV